jgi:hypothetical protein
MFSVLPTEMPPAGRARWLAELADALDEALRLLLELDLNGGAAAEARDLYVRIEAARLEVQSLRLSRSIAPRTEPDPEWSNLIPWPAERART